ncbi:MAG TPA: aminoacyl-tRNA hydrolase [Blastocatellia bacterium]|nr:aminoacyl-tRNA hydrolase [Blastocatellia bacterium]
MKLIVGLGNPGEQYAQTRHNLGFMVIDKLAADLGREVKTRECNALILRAELEGERVILAKPQTYMNLSGQSVAGLCAKSEIDSRDVIVISDDLALPIGKLRIRPRGSAGGHNGLKSIIELLRTDEFVRLRLGITPEHPIGDTKSFVLAPFPKTEQSAVREMVERAADAVRSVIADGVERAMARFN